MTPEQFCYWMQGFAELTPEAPTAEQWKAMKEHLGTVFHKVTPKAPGQLEDAFTKAIKKAREDAQRTMPPYQPQPSPWVPYGPYRLTRDPIEPLRVTC